MTRNLKALGLALMAMSALGAVVASAASAQTNGKITSAGAVPVTLTGEETPKPPQPGKNALTSFGTSLECNESTYTGHLVAQTPHTLIPSGSSTATLTPHYKQVDAAGTANCNASNGTSVTVDMNGCDYVIHIGETTVPPAPTHEYAATFDVICPVGQQITVTFFTTHSHAVLVCRVDVAEQKGLKGADVIDTSTTDGHIELTGTVEGIKTTKTATSVLCPEETDNNGKFDLDVTVKAHNSVGAPVGISLSH